jgi:hypothetical protein
VCKSKSCKTLSFSPPCSEANRTNASLPCCMLLPSHRTTTVQLQELEFGLEFLPPSCISCMNFRLAPLPSSLGGATSVFESLHCFCDRTCVLRIHDSQPRRFVSLKCLSSIHNTCVHPQHMRPQVVCLTSTKSTPHSYVEGWTEALLTAVWPKPQTSSVSRPRCPVSTPSSHLLRASYYRSSSKSM